MQYFIFLFFFIKIQNFTFSSYYFNSKKREEYDKKLEIINKRIDTQLSIDQLIKNLKIIKKCKNIDEIYELEELIKMVSYLEKEFNFCNEILFFQLVNNSKQFILQQNIFVILNLLTKYLTRESFEMMKVQMINLLKKLNNKSIIYYIEGMIPFKENEDEDVLIVSTTNVGYLMWHSNVPDYITFLRTFYDFLIIKTINFEQKYTKIQIGTGNLVTKGPNFLTEKQAMTIYAVTTYYLQKEHTSITEIVVNGFFALKCVHVLICQDRNCESTSKNNLLLQNNNICEFIDDKHNIFEHLSAIKISIETEEERIAAHELVKCIRRCRTSLKIIEIKLFSEETTNKIEKEKMIETDDKNLTKKSEQLKITTSDFDENCDSIKEDQEKESMVNLKNNENDEYLDESEQEESIEIDFSAIDFEENDDLQVH